MPLNYNQCTKKRANGQNRKTLNLISSHDCLPPVSLAPTVSQTPLAVGLSTAGVSLVTIPSFLFWLLKRLQKKGEGIYECTPKRFFEKKFFFSLMSHIVSHRLKCNQNQITSHLMINMNKLQDK